MSFCYLEATQLEKHIGQRRLFSIPNLKIYQGDRIGLIGQNGVGKSTLLSILSGETEPDKGHVERFVPLHLVHQFGAAQDGGSRQALKEFHVTEPAGRAERSGGEQTRLRLSEADLSRIKLLLCDEPTANLDAEGRALLQKKLRQCDTFVLVSHDRELLNGHCNHIWLLQEETITVYPGNYADYLQIKETEKSQQVRDYERYTRKKEQLEQTLQGLKQKAAAVRDAPRRMGNSEARLHKRAGGTAKKKLDSSRNAIQTRLDKMEKVDRPREETSIRLDFSLTDPPQTRIVIRGEHIAFGYDHPLFTDASFQLPLGSKTVLMGPNGAGKTTLLNLIQNRAAGIQITPKAALGVFRQEFETLDMEKTVLQNALLYSVQREAVVRTILSRLLFSRESLQKPAGVLSGGERVKLAFAQLFVSQANVFLLDEPTNYLDILSLSVLETMLKEYEGTVLFVSHDRAFTEAVADRLLFVQNGRLEMYEGTFSSYRQSQEAGEPLSKSILQMRLSQLMAQMTQANPAQKEQLEAEYASCLREYRALP